MTSEGARDEAKDEANDNEKHPNETPAISIPGGNEPKKQDSTDSNARTKQPRHDRYDWTHLAVLTFTFLAACAAAWEAKRLADLTDQLIVDGQETSKQQSELTRESNKLNREALVASSRAWVGPVDAKITTGAIEVGKPTKVMISVRNTGREPARNFRWIPERFVPTEQDDKNGTLARKLGASLTFCFGTPSANFAQVIYPSTGFGSGFDFTIEFAKDEIDETVVAGTKMLVIEGCLVYETAGATRHSAFCYFFKNGVSPPDHLNICESGSNAD